MPLNLPATLSSREPLRPTGVMTHGLVAMGREYGQIMTRIHGTDRRVALLTWMEEQLLAADGFRLEYTLRESHVYLRLVFRDHTPVPRSLGQQERALVLAFPHEDPSIFHETLAWMYRHPTLSRHLEADPVSRQAVGRATEVFGMLQKVDTTSQVAARTRLGTLPVRFEEPEEAILPPLPLFAAVQPEQVRELFHGTISAQVSPVLDEQYAQNAPAVGRVPGAVSRPLPPVHEMPAARSTFRPAPVRSAVNAPLAPSEDTRPLPAQAEEALDMMTQVEEALEERREALTPAHGLGKALAAFILKEVKRAYVRRQVDGGFWKEAAQGLMAKLRLRIGKGAEGRLRPLVARFRHVLALAARRGEEVVSLPVLHHGALQRAFFERIDALLGVPRQEPAFAGVVHGSPSPAPTFRPQSQPRVTPREIADAPRGLGDRMTDALRRSAGWVKSLFVPRV